MTVKIALKKKFNKNAATCFYTEYAKSVTCKTIPAAEIMARWALTKPTRTTSTLLSRTRTVAKALSATATLTFLSSEQEGDNMKASKQMAKALLTSGQYRTKKYLYTLGYNMYGQEIVQRTQIDSEGHRIGNAYSAGLFNAYDYPEEWREKNV